MTNFKQLKIWHRGLDIAVKSFKPTKEFPKEEKFRISSQITRGGSLNSIEYRGREQQNQRKGFIAGLLNSHRAQASNEETQLLISAAINFGNDDLRNEILRDLDEEQKMLISFISKLNK